MSAGIFLTPSWADSVCNTHEACASSADCGCTVPANSTYFRNYYVDFQGIQQGHTYECNLGSAPTEPQFLLNESTIPSGSKMTDCSRGCEFLPITLHLDTHTMTKQTDTLILKYQVPPSDYPSTITASCKIKD